ncbi:MAG: sulfatase [Saprospiraceae bacterium]
MFKQTLPGLGKMLFFGGLLIAASCTNSTEIPEKLNVLMIAVDDLRPELGAYGNQLIQTPNIDRLASEGVLFKNAYCNIPVCGASRASLLTSTRPTKHRYLRYNERADQKYPSAIPISQHFKDNGYRTISNGKIFHAQEDHAQSWDENWRLQQDDTGFRNYLRPENKALETSDSQSGPAFEAIEVPDSAYYDGKLALKAIQDIKALKTSKEPFFLSVGFVKPHLPFNAPQKYWDLYDRADFSPTEKDNWPANAPKQAFHRFGELRNYSGIPKQGPIDDSLSITLQHGYYAATSYVDHLVGMVLKALEASGLRENTVVILWGDHGWNLGEHGLWCKHCNFNTSLQAPLIISAPNFQKKKTAETLVEFVDIYPTLASLCGLSIPNTVEGKSLLPILEDPTAHHKDFIISQFQKGLTIKTERYAYTEWRGPEDNLLSNMLFDHENDPEERDNLADNAEYASLVDSLSSLMIANRGDAYFVDTSLED